MSPRSAARAAGAAAVNAPLRVGIVGARRVRQGLGPFVARQLVRAGAQVPAVIGTSPESTAAACADLEQLCGIRARGFTSLGALLECEPLDALAILVPHAGHAEYLEQAAAHGLHVLCEKPLVWGVPRPLERARELAERFAAARLLLAENCQWPYLLPAYAELHPGSLTWPPKRFGMRLCPASQHPLEMIADSLHHPLSVLQALLGADGGLEGTPRFAWRPGEPADGAGPRLELRFGYRAGGRSAEAEVVLESAPLLPGAAGPGVRHWRPRGAGLGWDGHWAERVIQPPDYSIYWAAGERSVRARDPLQALVEWFVGELRALREGRADPAVHAALRRASLVRMEALEALVRACRAEGHGS